MCVRVPVIFVRRRDHEKTANENGIKVTAKIKSATIGCQSSRHPAPVNNAARIPASEQVRGMGRARICSGCGNTETGYIIPPTKPDTQSPIHLAGFPRLKRMLWLAERRH